MTAAVRVPDLHRVLSVDYHHDYGWLVRCDCTVALPAAATLVDALTMFGDHVRAITYDQAARAVLERNGAIPSEPGRVSRVVDRIRGPRRLAGVVGRSPGAAAAAR